MAAKLIALYAQPEDEAAFEAHYFETHAPLARKMPGLQKLEVVKFKKNVMGGELPHYMMAEMTFNSLDELKAALGSPEGQAAGQDLMSFAANKFTLLTTEVVDKAVEKGAAV